MHSQQAPSALAPLRGPVFRMLWLAWFAANLTMAMNDVAAAWLMTSLSDSALLVALVQAASTLPMLLFGIPSGALADIADRRRVFAGTQLWVTLIAIALWALASSETLSPASLLVLTFANGIGLAMRWPVFAAIVPDIVPASELSAAVGLNGIAINLSRILGPVIAGALLAGVGSSYVFLANVLLSIAAFIQVMRWRSPERESALPGERFFIAMRVGIKHVAQSPLMWTTNVRIFLFFLQATSLTALLPLIGRSLHAGGPRAFTTLLAAMGAGAIICVLALPRLRAVLGRDGLVFWGTCIHALASVLVVAAPTLWLATPAMVVAGMAWIGTANSLTVTAQMALPNWVRARGMSIFQMAAMAGMAAGATLWGYVASVTTVTAAIVAAAIAGPLSMYLSHRFGGRQVQEEDLRPATMVNSAPPPAIDIEKDAGPVVVAIEYLIDPQRSAEFKAVMRETRRARLRQGALSWNLFRDTAEPERYVESFSYDNWIEHQRLFERFTAADLALRERRLAFHAGSEPPRIRRYLADAWNR